MANEQDRPAESGHGARPAGGSPTGQGRSGQAPVSMWADMLISGPDEADEPEPDGPGQQSPGYGSLHEGALGWQRPTGESPAPEQPHWEPPAPEQPRWGPPAPEQPAWHQPAAERPAWQQPAWPASPLPPSFGQRPVEGEKPAFDDPPRPVPDPSAPHPPGPGPFEPHPPAPHPPAPHPPAPHPPAPHPPAPHPPGPDPSVPGPFEPFAAEPGYPGYRPLDQPGQAAAAGYTPAHARRADDEAAQPGPPRTPAADETGYPDRDAAGPSYDPWETYETEAGHGWTGGYGFIAPEGTAPVPETGPSQDPAEGYGPYPPPYQVTPPQEQQPAWVYGEPADDHEPPSYDEPPAYGGPASYDEPASADELASYDEPPAHGGPAGDDGQAAAYLGYGFVAPAGEAPDTYQPSWQNGSTGSAAGALLPGLHSGRPSGWRRALYQLTGGLVRAPEAGADERRAELVARARTPVASGHHRVAVLSLKGGVGKTTTAVGLGATLASLRGDRVIALDANPDRGTLCDKLRLETSATVRDLLNESGHIRRYADVRAYTTQAPSGLEVLASDRDPTVSVAFSGEDYTDVAAVLENYYSVCIADCGTGLMHSAMAGVLRLADQIVLVSSASVDGARSASATLDWLAAHQYGDLVLGAVVVLSAIRPRSKSTVDVGRLEEHFAARCRAVVKIPYDAHLEEGAEVDLGQLSRATADAYLVLAAEVADGFAG